MVRPRVLSFMSEWGGGSAHRRNLSSTTPAPQSPSKQQPTFAPASASTTALDNLERSSPTTAHQRSDSRPSSRPMSMIQTYQPPVMEVDHDTLPELQRIFTFLNSHSNKLYQEGYFLKFHDTDTRGRPAADRVWQECFAQLVGTILSLWDASELDRAGGDAEVLPTFINLTDAALVMMPSMTLSDGKTLDNILSVSTAASNKYLFHFNSFNSLTQWTAGIRLAMYEHTTLQEAYTGALIAGKGKSLNSIRTILERQRVKHDDWARVRFGAGTPWRRCWTVVTPPDEKEYGKLQKAQKKTNIYNRSPIVLKGDIKFYDTKKITKKTRPIATVKEAYSAYAIYPQSKPLIDQSTLVKIEGKIIIHSKPESVTEGFVFVMPESHPAVSGFEIMLRFLFPVFDTFSLYGRPVKLISDVLDSRGLMFAMPPDRRYGYLEMWDVVSLIQTEGSQNWTERQWRKQLKDLTSKRMATAPARNQSKASSRRNTLSRASLSGGGVRFDERGSVQSQPASRRHSPARRGEFEPQGPRRVDSAPADPTLAPLGHRRSVSESNGYKQYQSDVPSRLAYGVSADSDADFPPPPPEHRVLNGGYNSSQQHDGYETSDGGSSPRDLPELHTDAAAAPPQGPVASPPLFAHAPSQKPPTQPFQPPPTMKPYTQMDPATLHQMADAMNTPLPAGIAVAGAAAAWRSHDNSADQYYQSSPPPRSGQPGNRLPTIPASPYVEHSEFVQQSASYQPMAPPVPEHVELSQQSRPSLELAQHRRSDSSQIHRKPIPGRSSVSSREDHDNNSTKSSSLGSLRNVIVNPEALDSLNGNGPLARIESTTSSRYDDDALSATTPDYASTISEESRIRKVPSRRADRPRSGVLKFVGNPDLTPKPEVLVGDSHYKTDIKKKDGDSDLPEIDFGPTYSLNPEPKRPNTSGTMTQASHDQSPRAKESPGDNKRRSYLAGLPNVPTHGRSSSTSPLDSDARSIAWQPAMVVRPQQDKSRLDPEEWVQQRAAAAAQPRGSPVYSHGRSKSHTPPPLGRQNSGDWTSIQRTPDGIPARSPSRPLSRPLSRGAGNLLVNERPTSLSAREQEQIARMTGTPLINLTKNKSKSPRTSSAGLVAYVENREQERAAAKANRNSHTAAMQAEIDRRMMAAQQRQMMEMQQMAMNQSGYVSPNMMVTPPLLPQQALNYGTPTQMPIYQQPQQQGYFPPQAMSPGWGSPSPTVMQAQSVVNGFVQQQTPTPIQPYGASYDQAQAQVAARYAQQQGQQYRR